MQDCRYLRTCKATTPDFGLTLKYRQRLVASNDRVVQHVEDLLYILYRQDY